MLEMERRQDVRMRSAGSNVDVDGWQGDNRILAKSLNGTFLSDHQ